jgi:hypothetical protein
MMPTGDASADGLQLACSFQPGLRLALNIDKNRVLMGGSVIKNLDRNSVVIGRRHITFSQKFETHKNAWRINRGNLRFTFKTVLKRDLKVVIKEKGSCASTASALRPSGSAHALLANVLDRWR